MTTKTLLIAAASLLATATSVALPVAAARAETAAALPTSCAAISAEMTQLTQGTVQTAEQQKKAARKRGLMGFAKALASNIPMANFGSSTVGTITTVGAQTAAAAMNDGTQPAMGMDPALAANQSRMMMLSAAAAQQNCAG